jgi:hypothetical protein
MARRVKIGGDGALFIGEDKVINFTVLNRLLVPVDITGMAFQFVVRADVLASQKLIDLPATVVGTYDAAPLVNTQRARVTLSDTDLSADVFSAQTYEYSLKRTDDGSETVVNFGPFELQRATQV